MVTSPLEIRKPLRKTALRSYHDILIGGSAYKTTASRKRSLKELADFSFVSLSAGTGTNDLYVRFFYENHLRFSPDMEVATTDQILPMVDKDDHETLEKALQIEEGKDQVTLFTCTPYGVNSHRLLVRGTRVPYNGEEDATESVTDSMVKAIQNYYMLYLILGLSITILVIILLRFLSKRKAHKE